MSPKRKATAERHPTMSWRPDRAALALRIAARAQSAIGVDPKYPIGPHNPVGPPEREPRPTEVACAHVHADRPPWSRS